MRESRVWKWIEGHSSAFLDFERVETLHPPGMSDCFFVILASKPNVTGWLELKYCEPNDKSYLAGHIPKLRPTQPMFLTRQSRKGVPCGILLRVGDVCSYVFKPTGQPEWNQEIRSSRAISMATMGWVGMPLNTWEMVTPLLSL